MVEIIPMIPSTIEILGTKIELLKLLISILIFVVGIITASIVRATVIRFMGKYIPERTEAVVKRFIYWSIIAVAGLGSA